MPIRPCIILALSILLGGKVYAQGRADQSHLRDTIPLKVDSLKAATVTAKSRPHLKGDTLEYNTSGVILRANATVEELLGRLPGLQVDAEGNITYNGAKIEHLLVEGEDIFGSNPTMITRNFDASKISKIQIINRKSEEARFTGMDDGTPIKTLNLVLKEDAKNGYFGKAEAGGKTSDYYNADGVFAAFCGKEQFTAIGLLSNTGTLNFSSTSGGASAAVNYLNGNADPLGASAGRGIPRFQAGALHYADAWNGKAEHLSANYQYSNYFSQPVTASQNMQIQLGNIYSQFDNSHSTNQQAQHWGYCDYDWAPNAASSLRVGLHGMNAQGQNQLNSTSKTVISDTLANSSERTIRDHLNKKALQAQVLWRIRLSKRVPRVFSIATNWSQNSGITDGYLYSLNNFAKLNGTNQGPDTTDQRKQIADRSTAIGSSISYIEPLWQGAVLGIRYGIDVIGSHTLEETFDRGDGKYSYLVDSLSSHLKTKTTLQRATVNIQGTLKKLNYIVGNDCPVFSYSQQDIFTHSTLHWQYFNWAPHISVIYATSPSINFNFGYHTNTQEPAVTQLEPIVNNSDPLHISLGNPNLRPAFNQNLAFGFQRLRTSIINVNLSLQVTNRAISNRTTTDSLGRQISQPVNVDGGRTAGVNFAVNRNIHGLYAGLHTAVAYARTFNYVSAVLCRNDTYTAGAGVSLNKYVADKFALQANTNFTYFEQVSRINPGAHICYWTQSHLGSLTLFVIRGLEINTNAVYTWQGRASTFTPSTSVLLWNAYVSLNFIRDKLVTKFQFNNILNTNSGVTRTNVANVNVETSTNILSRYWIVSVTYHFDHHFNKK